MAPADFSDQIRLRAQPRSWILLGATFLAAALLLLDLRVPLGVAGGVLYVTVVLISLWSPVRRDTFLLATVCTGLTVVGYFHSPAGGELWKVLANRSLAVYAIWAVALLADLHRRSQGALAASYVLSRELREAKEAAEASNVSKRQFLANMSHEIRTPMTAILGYAEELLEDGDLVRIPPERLHAIDAIRRNGNHLLQVINDILDLAKIEAGRLEIDPQSLSPLQLVAEVCSLTRVRASEKDLTLSSEFVGPMPATISADPTRIRQVLINLVANAIKFTERGTVRLVTQLIFDTSGAKIRFEVVDSGVGVPPEELPRLFQPFTQADASTTRTHGGTGLGLTISARLVEMMNGTIEAESEPGKGSTFRFTLPVGSLDGVPLVEEPSEPCPTAEPWRSDLPAPVDGEPLRCRILLAEDSPDNQRLLRRILERAGAEVEVATNGRIALECALEARENARPFDIVLMDMQMPVLDGYDATRALRRAGCQLPVIALTAYAMSADRQRCLEAGCDDFASKPIARSALIDTIRRHLAAGKREDPPAPA